MEGMYAEPGLTVTLVRLTTHPELIGTTAVLQRYLRRRQMWQVVLADGRVFAVKAENMRTRDMCAPVEQDVSARKLGQFNSTRKHSKLRPRSARPTAGCP